MEVRQRRPARHQAGPAGRSLNRRARLAAYGLILAVGIPVAMSVRLARTDPGADIARVLEAARAGDALRVERGRAAFFRIGDKAWTLSVFTGDAPRFGSDFVVVRRLKGNLIVERLTDPGGSGGSRTVLFEERLTEAAATDYLARVGIDPAQFDALLHRDAVAVVSSGQR